MSDPATEHTEASSEHKVTEEAKKPAEVVSSALRSLWLAGLGVPAAAAERGTELFRYLVEKGEKVESEGKERLKSASHTAGKAVETVESTVRDMSGKARTWVGKGEEALDQKIADAVKAIGVPTREDIQALNLRLDEIAAKIDQMQAGRRRKAEKDGEEPPES